MANFCRYKNLSSVDIKWVLPGNSLIHHQYNVTQLPERDLICPDIITEPNWAKISINQPSPKIVNNFVNPAYSNPNQLTCFYGLEFGFPVFTPEICPIEIPVRPDNACTLAYWAKAMDNLYYGAVYGNQRYDLFIKSNNVTTYETRQDGGKVTALYKVFDDYFSSFGIGELSVDFTL